MRLTSKIMLASAVKLLVFIALLAFSYLTIEKMLLVRQWTNHSREVSDRVNALTADLSDIETGERGYAITGKSTFLEPYTRGLRSLQNDFRTLKALTADNPEQQAAVVRLSKDYRSWLASEVNPLLALRGEVDKGAKPLRAVIDFISSERGKKKMDTLRAELSAIGSTEQSLLRGRQENLVKLTQRTRNLIVFGGAAGVLIGLMISFLTAWGIKRPLAEAADYARKVEAGEYSGSLACGRDDEIGILLSALRTMVERLVGNISILEEQSALLDLAHDAIFVRNMQGRIVFWNNGAEKTYGWSKEEALGKDTGELLKAWYPMPVEAITRQVLTTGSWSGELRHLRRDGKPIIVESRWAPRKDEKGDPAGFLEINRDITEHKEADRQLLSYMKKLKSSNSVLNDFAFVASHDLQEPLRKITIFSDMLAREFSGELPGDGQLYLQKIQDAATRMQELIQSLLLYSRVSTQTAPLVSVDLSELVQAMVHELEIPVKESGATIEVSNLPKIQADPTQMRQLFQNLIGNGLKFHGDRAPHIKVYGQPCRGESCQIFVQDNGIGFDEKYLDQIFKPFQRLHAKSSPYKGSGMGLTISRKIVDRHNGTITARSVPGEGSTFILTLPVEQVEESAREMSAA